MVFQSRFPVFAVTADIVALTLREGRLCVLLIRRSSSVFTGRWALPGGVVHVDEPLAGAAYRELRREAGLGRVAPGRLDRGGVHVEPVES